MLLTLPYSNTEPPFHFMYQCEWKGGVMLEGPIPPLPCHHVTIQEGVPPAVAASANAVAERSDIVSLNVRLVPSSPAEASTMSKAGWFGPGCPFGSHTGKRASLAGSVAQFPGGKPWVPLTDSAEPFRETELIATFAGVGSGSRFPWVANRLGPVRRRVTALMG